MGHPQIIKTGIRFWNLNSLQSVSNYFKDVANSQQLIESVQIISWSL